MTFLEPLSEAEAAEMIREARSRKSKVGLAGGGTRTQFGRPSNAATTLSSAKLTGVTLYEPTEMVISARTGTLLSEVTARLTQHNQMLPFEPVDHRPLFATAGEPTIGGIVALNASGPRRVQMGAVRDSLIGIRLVNGRGDIVKSGGRVMKNVTGLDLVKLSCGAFGTLGLLTEVTFKVQARPEFTATVCYEGLSDAAGVNLLCTALGLPIGVTGAAHLPASAERPVSVSLLRVEGSEKSLHYRLEKASRISAPSEILREGASDALWRNIRDVTVIADRRDLAIWKVSVRPIHGPPLMETLRKVIEDVRYFYDWSGGLVWLAVPMGDEAEATSIRRAVAAFGGHATLVRADDLIRQKVPVFQPLSQAIHKLTLGIKQAFDPDHILNPERMYANI